MPPTLLLLSRSLETKEGEFAVEGGKHWRILVTCEKDQVCMIGVHISLELNPGV